MRPALLPALLGLLLLAGGASVVSPVRERVELAGAWVEVPAALAALGGDVRVRVGGVSPAGLAGGVTVRLARDDDDGRALLASMPLAVDADDHLTLPCGYFSRGGRHYLELVVDRRDSYAGYDADNATDREKREAGDGWLFASGDSTVKSWRFDVQWPAARLAVTPEQIQTYPERQVTAILEFPKVVCTPIESSADYWLELLYCGHSSGGAVLCDGLNSSSHAHVLYSEQMHGFPGRRTLTLRCELFGQAGDYALTLRPASAAPPADLVSAFIKADWSEQFVLNVHGGAVFPCGGGVRALFQYPECALEGADRVRVFGRDGEAMKYVAEQRVKRGQHTASFDCRLFSERYPEYCFVYVSQAVTGAVADVRVDCLPTLPLTEGGAGGWGEWSAWSACPAPARCSTRTRSRHRFCDNPPPAYGAKYCEGQAVELASCACAARGWAGDAAGVVAEVGARCRCGCVLHLAPAARLLAGSARACPARSFWLLQAEEGLVVRLRMESVRLPCAGQSLRARDGDSLASPLLASWDGPDSAPSVTAEAQSADGGALEVRGGRHILVELRTADTSERCAGGFLAHAMQQEPYRNASAAFASLGGGGGGGGGGGAWWARGGGARGAALAVAALAAAAALLLAAHSAHRTRRYSRANDKDSLTDSDACSASLQFQSGSASASRSTLVSEVLALRRLLPARHAHTRLLDDERAPPRDGHRDEDDQASDSEVEVDGSVSGEEAGSDASAATVTPESAASAPAGPGEAAGAGAGAQGGSMRRCHTVADTHTMSEITSPSLQSNAETVTVDLSGSECERDDNSEKDRNSAWDKDRSESRASSTVSAATLTNGWYSPALSRVSAALVRDSSKRSKESSNRRLLTSHAADAAHASRASLASRASHASHASHAEMELDYYDYELHNADSVPGSYLGMDPAFLVWIPPLEEGDIIREMDENVYEEILPKEYHPDPGSNTESPEEMPSSSNLRKNNLQNHANQSTESIKAVRDRTNVIHPLNFSISDLQHSPNLPAKNKKKKDVSPVSIPMKDLSLPRSPARVHGRPGDDCATLKRVRDTARETQADTLTRTTVPADIKFADSASESSSDIRFADDSPDSNKLLDHYNLRA